MEGYGGAVSGVLWAALCQLQLGQSSWGNMGWSR
jgi:hypothetical protein